MRRMYSLEQLKKVASDLLESGDVSVINVDNINADNLAANEINGEENPSVKPIYCHPIQIVNNDESHYYRLVFMVFNNSATPFTYESFKAWLFALYTAVGGSISIMCSGAFKTDKTSVSDASITIANRIYTADGVNVSVSGISTLTARVNIDNISEASLTFSDGVNKIN